MDVVYFSVNNWFGGRDYPELPIIEHGLYDEGWFSKNDWVEEQKLCIKAGPIDMSMNYCITAPRSWVEDNCPELLTDEEYTYDLILHDSTGDHRVTYTKKYSDFVFEPNEDDGVEDRFGWSFLDYNEDNIGITWCSDDYYADDDDEFHEDEED